MERKKKEESVFPSAVLIVKFTLNNRSSDLHKYIFSLADALKLEKRTFGKY